MGSESGREVESVEVVGAVEGHHGDPRGGGGELDQHQKRRTPWRRVRGYGAWPRGDQLYIPKRIETSKSKILGCLDNQRTHCSLEMKVD